MKRIAKLITVLSLATAFMVTPVFAALPEPNQLLVLEAKHGDIVNAQLADLIVKANGNPDGPQWSAHRKAVADQLVKLNYENAITYVQLLKTQVQGKQENERVKLEVLNNYKSLALVNPAYEAMIPQALADYQKAVAETQAAQMAVINAAATLGVSAQ